MFKAVAVTFLFLAAASVSAQSVVVDNADPGFSVEAGTWETGTATGGKFGPDYRFTFATSSPTPTARVRFTPTLPMEGYYYVSVWYNTGTNRAINSPYTVHGDTATSTVRVNQQLNGSQFFYIGQMHFAAGTGGSVSVANDAASPDFATPVVMADAVEFVYAGPTPGPEPGDENPVGPPEEPELRGLWVSRFEWPKSTQTQTKGQLDTIINRMADANFNAIFLQVRGQMETLYPSPNEPWAKQFSHQPQSYDPMAYAITKSHLAGLQFHAYINTHVIYQGATPPVVPGGQPVHPFFTHGNPDDPAHRDWVYHTSDGQPQALGAGEELYDWAAPGVPTFQQWTRDQVVYVAQNYNVDGVHFDRIRFAGNGSYDPISMIRSAVNSPSNPSNLSFRNWSRDQITRLLNDIYGAVAEINYNRPASKPEITVSSAPYRGKSQQESVNQMLGAWTGIGAQDFFVPQVYDSGLTNFSANLNSNFPLANGRQVVAGMSRNSTGNFENTRDQILRARELGAAGTVIFSYTAFPSTEFAQYSDTIYRTKVSVPAMEWLTTPTESIIVGNVTDSTGAPIVDAQLQRTGSSYKWLSGSDGFYAMLKSPAATPLTLTVTKAGLPVRTVAVDPLLPGEVRRVNIAVGETGIDEWTLY